MNVPLIVIKTSTDGLGLFTQVKLTGLRLVLEVEKEGGELLSLAPEDLAPHPGCADILGCCKLSLDGKAIECQKCEERNKLQLHYIGQVLKCLDNRLEWLRRTLENITEGVFG